MICIKCNIYKKCMIDVCTWGSNKKLTIIWRDLEGRSLGYGGLHENGVFNNSNVTGEVTDQPLIASDDSIKHFSKRLFNHEVNT